MTQHTGYKTREDGTIDYAHYMARGRRLRSLALLRALHGLSAAFLRTRPDEPPAQRIPRPEIAESLPVERREALAAEYQLPPGLKATPAIGTCRFPRKQGPVS